MSTDYDASLEAGTRALTTGDYDLSVAQFTIAVQRASTLAEQADALHRLGMAQWRRGDRERSAVSFRDAVDLRRSGDPLMLAESLNSLGAVLVELEDPEQSIKRLLEAHGLRSRHAGSQATVTLTTLNNLAVVCTRAGRLDEARDILRRTILPMVATRGPQHQRVAGLLNNLGGVEEQLGNTIEAERHYAEAVRILRRTAGDLARETQTARGNLARIRANKGKSS